MINEILYHHRPTVEPFAESAEEWVEIYNRNATQTIDLTGWKLTGGIDFDFAPGTMIAPNDYLVVARDPVGLAGLHPSIDIVGPFSRRLGDNNDAVVLQDAQRNPADEVHYYEGGRWPEFADGGGVSLELRDPDADNSIAEAWAASHESSRSTWNTYSIRQTAEADTGPSGFNELVLGLLDAGEFLIDDVSVRRDPDGANVELIQNGTFDTDSIGGSANKWRVIGNHDGTVVDDPDDAGANQALHIVSASNTRHQHDHAETTLTSSINIGTEYLITFRAKWLAGSPQLNNRLYFSRVAETVVLAQPAESGTPGAVNSTVEANIGPTYSDLAHGPIVPTSAESVTVTVLVDDPDGVGSVNLWWSVNEGAWSSTPMSLAGGKYSGSIPAQSSGAVVQFYVEAQDALGASSTFPADGVDSRALYRVDNGQGATTAIDTMHLIMLPSDANGLLVNTELCPTSSTVRPWRSKAARSTTMFLPAKKGVCSDAAAR